MSVFRRHSNNTLSSLLRRSFCDKERSNASKSAAAGAKEEFDAHLFLNSPSRPEGQSRDWGTLSTDSGDSVFLFSRQESTASDGSEHCPMEVQQTKIPFIAGQDAQCCPDAGLSPHACAAGISSPSSLEFRLPRGNEPFEVQFQLLEEMTSDLEKVVPLMMASIHRLCNLSRCDSSQRLLSRFSKAIGADQRPSTWVAQGNGGLVSKGVGDVLQRHGFSTESHGPTGEKVRVSFNGGTPGSSLKAGTQQDCTVCDKPRSFSSFGSIRQDSKERRSNTSHAVHSPIEDVLTTKNQPQVNNEPFQEQSLSNTNIPPFDISDCFDKALQATSKITTRVKHNSQRSDCSIIDLMQDWGPTLNADSDVMLRECTDPSRSSAAVAKTGEDPGLLPSLPKRQLVRDDTDMVVGTGSLASQTLSLPEDASIALRVTDDSTTQSSQNSRRHSFSPRGGSPSVEPGSRTHSKCSTSGSTRTWRNVSDASATPRHGRAGGRKPSLPPAQAMPGLSRASKSVRRKTFGFENIQFSD